MHSRLWLRSHHPRGTSPCARIHARGPAQERRAAHGAAEAGAGEAGGAAGAGSPYAHNTVKEGDAFVQRPEAPGPGREEGLGEKLRRGWDELKRGGGKAPYADTQVRGEGQACWGREALQVGGGARSAGQGWEAVSRRRAYVERSRHNIHTHTYLAANHTTPSTNPSQSLGGDGRAP
jgi:hypothetical protein